MQKGIAVWISRSLKDGDISQAGEWAIIMTVASGNKHGTSYFSKLVSPNVIGLFFTSPDIAAKYVDECSNMEPDLRSSNWKLFKRIGSN
jgi:hypothetical protein